MASGRQGKSKSGEAGPAKAGQTKAGRPRHYGIERWVDFARGLAAEGEAIKMMTHAEGCTECRDLMTFCAKVAAVTQFMALQPLRANSGTG